ncbi:MAG: FAD-dependent oxidoreductase [Gammaproteobacteria bacterium]|nr:FAD-dependent oxidoreductase [Gammaproteobacteria bacterium]
MSLQTEGGAPLNIAVVGGGIAGLSAAWLLDRRHRVTLYEANGHLGGHSNTVTVDDAGRSLAIDTGFIVYNAPNYPNLVALFEQLGVATHGSDMSFAASLDDGRFEYAGSDLAGLLAQPRNLLRPRFWRMLGDVLRFYREAPDYLAGADADLPLAALLERHAYSQAFSRDHLMPMAAAIWSACAADIRQYPARAFIQFCMNHGLLQLSDRPQWRTVVGGAREYVERLRAQLSGAVLADCAVRSIERLPHGVALERVDGRIDHFDHVVVATHADDALALLRTPSADEQRLLGAFRYARNVAYLHTDARLMPLRRRAWASWNFLERGIADDHSALCVSYWMNRLQPLASRQQWFVTLNPGAAPAAHATHYSTTYHHPQFDGAALAAQRALWDIQGVQRTWFCGSYWGYGFHEDGLQSGLLVAEQLGGVRRPWAMPAQTSRVPLPPAAVAERWASAA